MVQLTVAITTCDRWESCIDAIQAVAAQDLQGVEILLVDDCSSTPAPDTVASTCAANDVRYVRHHLRRGLAQARNTALELARGEYFAFCDDDDRWPRDLASNLVRTIEREGERANMCIVLTPLVRKACRGMESPVRLTELQKRGITPPVGSQMYRTDLLREIGGYNASIRSGVDHDLWIRLAARNPACFIYWGQGAFVRSDPHADRMTTRENVRRSEIRRSLDIWRADIESAFGPGFYEHFCESYEAHLNFGFFMKSIRRGDWLDGMKRVFHKGVLRNIMAKGGRKLIGRSHCGSFPPYLG
jgi:glycosyltransferase involved in cell wall biosynthesis